MPYYSELGIYTPSISYSSGLIKGPYSNHSSIVASNILPPSSKQFHRSNFRGYKPLLTTISESSTSSTIRRINSPKVLYHSSPKVRVSRPLKINTADIDVSVNKYKKYDRPQLKPQSVERGSPEKKSPSLKKEVVVEEKDAKPNTNIRRDRATIRLQTVHQDALEKEIGEIKSWRDNFKPHELVTEAKVKRKTPGELLKEKFLIRSKSKEHLNKLDPPESVRKSSVKKSPSFKDICDVITSDTIVEDLNPGQPLEVRKRQSRQLSHDDLLREIKRSSSTLSIEEVQILDELLQAESEAGLLDIPPVIEEVPKGAKRKKAARKKSSEKVCLDDGNNETEYLMRDGGERVPMQRKVTQKKILRKSSSEISIPDSSVTSYSRLRKDSSLKDMVKDISQVEIEMIPIKHRQVITGFVGDIDEKPTIKAIVDDVEVEESQILAKKEKKFRFNVTVEEMPVKKVINARKYEFDKNSVGVVRLPCPQKTVVLSILKRKEDGLVGNVVEVLKETKKKELVKDKLLEDTNIKNKLLKSLSEVQVRQHDEVGLQKSESNDSMCSSFVVMVNRAKSDEGVQRSDLTSEHDPGSGVGSGKLRIVSIEKDTFVSSSKDSVNSVEGAFNKVVTQDKESIPKFDIKPKNYVNTSEPASLQSVSSLKTTLKDLKVSSKEDVGKKELLPKSSAKLRKEESCKTELKPNQTDVNTIDPVSKLAKIEDQEEIGNKIDDCIEKPKTDENDNNLDFWESRVEEKYEPPKLSKLKLELKDPRTIFQEIQESQKEVTEEKAETPEEYEKRMMSKRSLVAKATKSDPDLKVFDPPTPPPPEPMKEPSPEPSFVPLQSNRLSQWMHPWKKPEQRDDCSVEIFAKPKFIRARHIPRRWRQEESEDSEDSEDSEGSEDSTTSEEDSNQEESEDEERGASCKVGASTSSDDSGFDSGRANKKCDVNCHKKCEKLMANLCGVNQKLVVEAIEKVRKGSTDSRDSPGSTLNPASNPAFALDSNDLPEEACQSSTYQSFQRSGRITPPATTIPRFRKYCVDDFNFLKVLGKGSFGKVLLAELKGTEYYYAIKCLKKDVVLEDDDVECTLIERKVLALGTKHPYLCHLLCTFQTESHLFFVMEYLNGGDLMFHIQVERRFSEARARFYGAEIVSGLKFLHNKGIVYRDLKLDNILLDFDGHVRIADFGMCKLQIFLDRMADTFCGTPDYMAPEIIKGQHYNQCVDWWSFGVLLYEMLLGQSPFSGCDEDELFWSICNEKPVIPRFLSAEATSVLTQFLDKDANKRLGHRFSPHGDIQDHPFFKPIDWTALEARQLEPPFKPNLQHPLDTQYFDKTFTTEKAKLTPIENTILQSIDQTQFQGFSYTNPNATDK